MSAFTATIFATTTRTNDIEQRLNAYAFLFEGERPVWEIHTEGKVFHSVCQPDNILEQGILQINKHCHPNDQSNDIINSGIQFTLITWPGIYMPNKKQQIANWQLQGINIVERI